MNQPDNAPLSPNAARGARVLAEAVLILGLLLAVIGIAQAIQPLLQEEVAVAVTIEDPAAILADDIAGLPDDARLELPERSAELVVTGLGPGLRALTGLPDAMLALLYGFGAWLIRGMLLLVASGRAFDRGMPWRLRALSLVVLAGVLVQPALAGLVATAAVQAIGGLPEGGGLGFVLFELSFVPLLLVVLIGITGQVFESGRKLTEDLEGLV